MGSLRVIIDPAVPQGEIRFVSAGRIVGRIILGLMAIGLLAVPARAEHGASAWINFRLPGPDSTVAWVDANYRRPTVDTTWVQVPIDLAPAMRIGAAGDTVYVWEFSPRASGFWQLRVCAVGRGGSRSPWSAIIGDTFDVFPPGAPVIRWEEP